MTQLSLCDCTDSGLVLSASTQMWRCARNATQRSHNQGLSPAGPVSIAPNVAHKGFLTADLDLHIRLASWKARPIPRFTSLASIFRDS